MKYVTLTQISTESLRDDKCSKHWRKLNSLEIFPEVHLEYGGIKITHFLSRVRFNLYCRISVIVWFSWKMGFIDYTWPHSKLKVL